MIPLIQNLKNSQRCEQTKQKKTLTDTENRLVVTREWGRGEVKRVKRVKHAVIDCNQNFTGDHFATYRDVKL